MSGDYFNDTMGKLVLRLTVGGLMLFHGVAKILHPASLEFIGGALANIGLPAFIGYGVYVGEVVAPLMVMLGVYCRLGGLIIAVNMVFAIMLAHMGDLFTLTPHGGWAVELQAFYLLGGVVVLLMGSGRLAIRPD